MLFFGFAMCGFSGRNFQQFLEGFRDGNFLGIRARTGSGFTFRHDCEKRRQEVVNDLAEPVGHYARIAAKTC